MRADVWYPMKPGSLLPREEGLNQLRTSEWRVEGPNLLPIGLGHFWEAIPAQEFEDFIYGVMSNDQYTPAFLHRSYYSASSYDPAFPEREMGYIPLPAGFVIKRRIASMK